MKDKISKLSNVYKKYGLIGFMKKLRAYIIANYLDKVSIRTLVYKKRYQNKVRKILSQDFDRVILWRSSFGYDVPLYQRPQHISKNLAEQKCLVFYEVSTMTDKVKTLKKQGRRLYLINFNNIILNKILMEELSTLEKPKYVQLYSTDWKLSVENIKDYISKGFEFIYEYIDDLSPVLSGTKELPKNITDKYDYVMSNDDVYTVVTADLLKEDVIAKRGTKNLIFSTNGVDYKFFQKYEEVELEKEFIDVINNGKLNVCYYGALAKWFDYDLLKEMARTGNYNLILFGIKYDESYDENIQGEDNIYFMGARQYEVLKYYAKACDVLIIPFLINDITKATSPVKIFEYMALHKPIVTTDMNECRKYKSVFIGENKEEFIRKVNDAFRMKDNREYIGMLDKEARENDWSQKAASIIKGIR